MKTVPAGELSVVPATCAWDWAGALRDRGLSLAPTPPRSFGSEDPADRFLVATAFEQELTLVTADEAMRDFDPVQTVW